MPSGGRIDERIVIDESSFDFRGLSDTVIEDHLDSFAETLHDLRKTCGVSRLSLWDAVTCLDGCELHEFLSGAHTSKVDRDTLRRCYTAIDRCSEWDEGSGATADLDVRISGAESTTAPSVGYALAAVLAHRGVACLVFGGCERDGLLEVAGDSGEAQVFFLGDAAALPQFWRTLYSLEDIPERHFYEFATTAFPALVFTPALSFRRFDGTYAELRDHMVAVLAGINDHFADAIRDGNGVSDSVQKLLGTHHVNLSLESTKTHRNAAAMRQRDVVHDGRTYRCEWHVKLHPARNRVHVFPPCDELDGKILVGIFVNHLDT